MNTVIPTSAAPASGEEPILAELALAGYEARSLADLRHSGLRYRAAIPVLLRWLPIVTERRLAEEIVRALSVPWAKPDAVRPLIDAFVGMDFSCPRSQLGLGWTIGNAIEIVFVDSVFEELSSLALNRTYGRAREMIVLGFAKSRRAEAADLLIGLADDPDVDGHAVSALSKMKFPAARDVFLQKLDDRRAWVRRKARDGLKRLETTP